MQGSQGIGHLRWKRSNHPIVQLQVACGKPRNRDMFLDQLTQRSDDPPSTGPSFPIWDSKSFLSSRLLLDYAKYVIFNDIPQDTEIDNSEVSTTLGKDSFFVEGLVTLSILCVHDLENVDFALERDVSSTADYQRPVTAFAFLERGVKCNTESQKSSHHDSKRERIIVSKSEYSRN